MASQVPIVRQFAWSSLLVHLFVLALVVIGAVCWGGPYSLQLGVVTYLIVSYTLMLGIPRDHHKGVSLLKQGRYEEAIPHFERSYAFFSLHRWLDDFRYLVLLSSSSISYREMALVNIAYIYALLGNGELSLQAYQRALAEFPRSILANSGLRMLEAGRSIVAGGSQI